MITLKNMIIKLLSAHFANSIITTWVIIILVLIFSWAATKKLVIRPGNFQTICEGIISIMYSAVENVLPTHAELVFPFIATMWIFIFLANMIGVIPGAYSPTADLSVTAALATLVFFSTHWFGIKAEGFKNYLHHYITPSPLILPFHLIGEITRILALAIRLFGNMLSLELTVLIILMIAGFLVPVPILMLHIVEACLQTYIFGMLALIYIAGGIQSHELRAKRQTSRSEERRVGKECRSRWSPYH